MLSRGWVRDGLGSLSGQVSRTSRCGAGEGLPRRWQRAERGDRMPGATASVLQGLPQGQACWCHPTSQASLGPEVAGPSRSSPRLPELLPSGLHTRRPPALPTFLALGMSQVILAPCTAGCPHLRLPCSQREEGSGDGGAGAEGEGGCVGRGEAEAGSRERRAAEEQHAVRTAEGGAGAARGPGPPGAGEQVGRAGAVGRPGLPPTRGMLSCPLSGPQHPRHWGPLLQQPCLMEWGRVLNETVRVKGSPRPGRHTDTQTPTRFPAG